MKYRNPDSTKIGTGMNGDIFREKSRSNLFTDWMVLRYGDGVSNNAGLRLGTWEPRIVEEGKRSSGNNRKSKSTEGAIARGGITRSSVEASVMEVERRGDLNR